MNFLSSWMGTSPAAADSANVPGGSEDTHGDGIGGGDGGSGLDEIRRKRLARLGASASPSGPVGEEATNCGGGETSRLSGSLPGTRGNESQANPSSDLPDTSQLDRSSVRSSTPPAQRSSAAPPVEIIPIQKVSTGLAPELSGESKSDTAPKTPTRTPAEQVL